MRSHRNRRHRWARLVGLALIVSSCNGSAAETTTTSSVPETTTTSSTTTTTTTPLIANGPALVFEGDSNETVAAFQFLMNCNGYGDLTVDGVFGPATRGAIEEMQTALGREATGAPDEETLALLSRGCSEDRRVTVDAADAGEQIMVGNTAPDDPETYFIRADEGMRLSVVVTSDSGGAVVDVRSASGGAVGPASTAAWAADITETADYVIDVGSMGDPVTFTATFGLVEVDLGSVDSAKSDTIEVDGEAIAITDVCLDTTGELSYVAEAATAYLIVTTDTVGSFAVEHGGVGAPVELVYKDGSPGYVGFAIDFTIDSGDAIEGTGHAFLQAPGNVGEPTPFAFAFGRSAVPCEGAPGIPIVLAADGLGAVDFGAGADETLGFIRSALPGASPTVDSGWVAIDNQSNPYGICRQGTTEVRVMVVDNLTLYFSDRGSSFAAEGTRHFVGYRAEDGVFPFATGDGIGPGSTVAEVLGVAPQAVPLAAADGGVAIYLASPPGDDHWLVAIAADASGPSDTGAAVTAILGGRFCDL